MPSASRLFALLYLFSLEKEEENGEKRKGKEAALAASPGARGLRRSEAGGEVRVAARSLLAFFFFLFFFFGKGGVSLCKPMTQPHMGRPRPLQRLLTTNRLSRGISGSAKVHIGAAGGRGGRALRALPGPAPPERPSRSAGGLGSGRGSCHCGPDSGPSSSAHSTWGHRRPATWGGREPGRAWAQRPGVALAPPGPRQACGADLPPSRPRGSNFLLGLRAGRFCLLRPAGSGAGQPQGALALPKSGSGRRCPRLGREAAMAAGARGGGPVCWNLQRLCSVREAKHFYTLEKNVPVAWISLGLFLKPRLGGELRAPRDRGALPPWGPVLGSRGAPSAAGSSRHSDAPRLVSRHQT